MEVGSNPGPSVPHFYQTNVLKTLKNFSLVLEISLQRKLFRQKRSKEFFFQNSLETCFGFYLIA